MSRTQRNLAKQSVAGRLLLGCAVLGLFFRAPIATADERPSQLIGYTPVWSADSLHAFYSAKLGESIELLRVDLDGKTTQPTKSKPGTRHYQPAASPDGKWVLFGSDRSGAMQLHAASVGGKKIWPISNVPAGLCVMHGHWQPCRPNKQPSMESGHECFIFAS
mgnify:CR=1 FL=1